MPNLLKPFVVENMVLVAVVGDESYIFNRQQFSTWYGNLLSRPMWLTPRQLANKLLEEIDATRPREFVVEPSSGLGQRTSFIFWFPAQFDLNKWRGKVVSLAVIKQDNPRKARVIETAYARVDPLLRAA
jgi:hypothetical protein